MSILPLSFEARAIYIPSYDYFAIKDQSGAIWYWWVTASGDMLWGSAPGAYVHRNARAVVLSPVPSWLVLVDGTSTTRYVYPKTLTGELLVMPSAPAVGVGYTGSPRVQGMNLRFVVVAANHVQEGLVNAS
jgi:hypothetical protein